MGKIQALLMIVFCVAMIFVVNTTEGTLPWKISATIAVAAVAARFITALFGKKE
ncbi:MAG: hypothetical protein V1716_00150 [Candidatus Uhrbacteria bacterium]